MGRRSTAPVCDGNLKGFATPFGPPPATSSPLASPFGDFGTCTFPTTPARYARALALGLAKPCALASAGNEGARAARGAGRVAGRPEVPVGGAHLRPRESVEGRYQPAYKIDMIATA